jgi:hypothetical protein
LHPLPASDFRAVADFTAVAKPKTELSIEDRAAMAEREPIGILARRVFAAQCRSPLPPGQGGAKDSWLMRWVVVTHLLRLMEFGLRFAGAVKRERGIGIHRQILDLFRLALIHNVDPAAYYTVQLYDQPGGIAAAAHYLGRHETKNGIYNLLIDQRPEIVAAAVSLRDKCRFATRCAEAGLPVPAVLAIVTDGRWAAVDPRPNALNRDLFVKPVRSKGAAGAGAYRFQPPAGYIDDEGQQLTRNELGFWVGWLSLEKPMMVSERLGNHPEIADLADQSAITFRVFTCIGPDEVPVVTHAMLRTLAKLEPDWGSDAEFAAAVDLATGRLGPMCNDTELTPNAWWRNHPKTGALVEGRLVANWPAIADLARRAHLVFRHRRVIGWDIVLTPEGPVLLEGNVKPDVNFLQRVHRQLMGQSPLAPLLRHYLARAESSFRESPGKRRR